MINNIPIDDTNPIDAKINTNILMIILTFFFLLDIRILNAGNINTHTYRIRFIALGSCRKTGETTNNKGEKRDQFPGHLLVFINEDK